jgi:outer membrane lipoprotein-sorting protein
MRRLVLWVGVVITATGVHGSASAQALPNVKEVTDHLDDLYRSSSSYAVMTMIVVRERGTRELTAESWSRGDDESLIVIRSPAREAGTATLRTGDGLWNYAPRADRLIRVPSGLLSENWMGSHFTNDDLLRETSYLDDHDGSLAWVDVGETRYLEVTMTPRPDAPVVYTRLVYLLVPDAWTPYQAEYYDEGELVRTMTFDQVQTVSGRQIPMRMVLQPADDPNERTEIIYTDLQLDIPVDASMFSRRGLRRVAGN